MDNRFPWIPTIAPLVAAVVLWLVTGSAISMLFGIMSPVLLVASFVEARLNAKRRRARESHQERLSHARETMRLEEEQRKRLRQAEREHPRASELGALVSFARLPAERRKTPGTASTFPSNGAKNSFDKMIRIGTHDDGFPFLIGASEGLHIEGDARLRRSLLRAVTAQMWWITGDPQSSFESLSLSPVGAGGLQDARWHITMNSADTARVRDRDAPAVPALTIRPDSLSSPGLVQLRHALTVRLRDSLDHGNRTTTFAGVDHDPTSAAFDIEVGLAPGGRPFHLNLVESGPHMVVSGTTGSGKTTFLVNWLSQLASAHKCSTFELAIIDFKGGVDFTNLATWPHCVGFATDLEDGAIERALAGLEAEVSRRERALRSGDHVRDLSRLVVVLDEFRATAAAHPRSIPVVVDIAARGRALGMHLVLSTQRASSSISDDILANVALRVAFRALTPHESVFLVGNASAHHELRSPGDAVVSTVGAAPTIVHMYPPRDVEDPRKILSLPSAGSSVAGRHVWTTSLPTKISRQESERYPPLASQTLEGGQRSASPSELGVCVGLVDALTRQRWESAWYVPLVDGHLMVTGAARSGRTSAMRSFALAVREADQALTREPNGKGTSAWEARLIDDAMDMWDWLDSRCRDAKIAEGALAPDRRSIILLDGLERMLSLVEPEVRDVLGERLMAKMRNAGADRVIVACDVEGPWVTRLAPLCAQRLTLMSSDIPGRGRWKNEVVQVSFTDDKTTEIPLIRADVHHSSRTLLQLDSPIVVVTGRHGHSGVTEEHLGSLVASATAPEWGERLHEFLEMTRGAAILVDGKISPADARLLLRAHAPVPPMADAQRILLLPDGGYHRLCAEPNTGRDEF